MLSQNIDNAEHAMKQASMTANQYAHEAFQYMENFPKGFEGWSPEAKSRFVAAHMNAAALDFLGGSTVSAGQHIAEALNEIRRQME